MPYIFTSNIPWDTIKANTLRTVCAELGCRATLTKANMIVFLHDLEEHGLETALEKLELATAKPEELSPSPEPTTPRARRPSLKRKKADAPVEEEPQPDTGNASYNTRHKGQKRVRVTADPLPKTPVSRRRKSAASPAKKRAARRETDEEEEVDEEVAGPSKSASTAGKASSSKAAPAKKRGAAPKSASAKTSTVAAAKDVDAPKRGRGRPKKDVATKAKSSKPQSKKAKEVFDGVVIQRKKTKEIDGEEQDGEYELEEEEVEEVEEEIVDADNGGAVASNETSSLGSSNKENHPHTEDPSHATSMSLADAINSSHGVNPPK